MGKLAGTGAKRRGDPWRNLWQTDPEFILELIRVMGRTIVLDVASSRENHVSGPFAYITEEDNALSFGGEVWASLARMTAELHGIADWMIFANPPFDVKMPWVLELIEAARAGATVALLCPDEGTTEWARTALFSGFCEMVFIPVGRLAYIAPPEAPKDKVNSNGSPAGGSWVIVLSPRGVEHPPNMQIHRNAKERLEAETKAKQGVLL